MNPDHPHRTHQNSLQPHGTLSRTQLTSINCYLGVLKQKSLQAICPGVVR